MEDHSLNRRLRRRRWCPARWPLAAVLILTVTLVGGGCRNKPPEVAGQPAPPPTKARPGKAQSAAVQIPPDGLPAWGRKELLAVGDPALKRACVQVRQRYLWIDRVEVMPGSVQAGSEMNHRFVYTFCPEGPVPQIKGTLTTRVIRDGRPLIVDREEGYVLSPGQWAVDARIVIPTDADPGRYTLETSFVAGGAAFKRAAEFAVY